MPGLRQPGATTEIEARARFGGTSFTGGGGGLGAGGALFVNSGATVTLRAGCSTVLHAGAGSYMAGAADTGTVTAALTADDITAPLNISGILGNVNCSATLGGMSGNRSAVYSVAADPLGNTFAYALTGADVGTLSATSLTTSGCGLHDYLVAFGANYFGPQALGAITTDVNDAIAAYFPTGGFAPGPGVDATVCPSP